jgi:hypothetical protein
MPYYKVSQQTPVCSYVESMKLYLITQCASKKSSLHPLLSSWTALGCCGQGAGREQKPDSCAALNVKIIFDKILKNRVFPWIIKF